MAIKVTLNVPFGLVRVVVIVRCVPKSMERVDIPLKPVPCMVITVPGMPEVGLTEVIEASMQKVAVAMSWDGPEAVIVFIPEDWVLIMKVAENVPFSVEKVYVIVFCVPKSILTDP